MKLANKKAITIAFAQVGAHIVISYRSDKKGAENTVAKIQEMGGSATALYSNFSETEKVESFFQAAIDTLGSIDILVNNADGYDVNPFLELTIDQFEHLAKVGPAAPMLRTQLVAKEMIKHHNRGSILNISSTSGNRPYPNRIAHPSAKAAFFLASEDASWMTGQVLTIDGRQSISSEKVPR